MASWNGAINSRDSTEAMRGKRTWAITLTSGALGSGTSGGAGDVSGFRIAVISGLSGRWGAKADRGRGQAVGLSVRMAEK